MTCIRPVVAAYLTGLHWVLQYYYRGVASWDWFYPHHYAPMAQDMVELDQIAGEYEEAEGVVVAIVTSTWEPVPIPACDTPALASQPPTHPLHLLLQCPSPVADPSGRLSSYWQCCLQHLQACCRLPFAGSCVSHAALCLTFTPPALMLTWRAREQSGRVLSRCAR